MHLRTRILSITKEPTIFWPYLPIILNQITSYYQTSTWPWEAFLPTKTFSPLFHKSSYQAFRFLPCKNQISTTLNLWWQDFPKLDNSKSTRSLGCSSLMSVRNFHKLPYKIAKDYWNNITKSIMCSWWTIWMRWNWETFLKFKCTLLYRVSITLASAWRTSIDLLWLLWTWKWRLMMSPLVIITLIWVIREILLSTKIHKFKKVMKRMKFLK